MQNELKKPSSHKTFVFGIVTLSSEFDSGNLVLAERQGPTAFNISIGTDHPQNNYRTWFHFSVQGIEPGSIITFNIKNMHNQTRLLNDGLVPVFRNEGQTQWKRIQHPINTNAMFFNNQGFLQFTFKHTFTTEKKVYLAFFYPWSLEENQSLLKQLQQKAKGMNNVYFHRTVLVNSWEGRPVELVTISSLTKISKQQEQIDEKILFPLKNKPKAFLSDKKAIFVSARVHPGEVPSSHVMNGILKGLLEDTEVSQLIRDKFVFYLVPIINPDGVYRGHYRTDRNGVNLNRYYLGPSPKQHSPIFAIKKFILHLHNNNRFFSSLDLHAHAGRKGMFIYGNYSNQLKTQLEICLFPKILSMNSHNFQYEACNFTEKNMYAKDKSDMVSKQGSARVAIFKATKSPYCWTLQCNYNMNRIQNQICNRNDNKIKQIERQQKFDQNLICNYQNLNPNEQPKNYFTIATYQQLGHEILDSYLDLLEIHPYSRITNPDSRFKHIHNLKLNLLIALMKMTPYHFQSPYRKLLLAVQNQKQQTVQRGIKALYQIFVKGNQISNLQEFLRNDSLKAPQFKKRIRINRSNFEINAVKRRKTANQQLKLAQEDQNFNKVSQQTTNQTNAEEFTLVNIKNVSKDASPATKQKTKLLKQQAKQQNLPQVELPSLSINTISSNRRHQQQQQQNLYDNECLQKKMREYVEKSRPEQILISNLKGMLALKVVNLKIGKPTHEDLVELTNNLKRVQMKKICTSNESPFSRATISYQPRLSYTKNELI